jgi:hypothetical protein
VLDMGKFSICAAARVAVLLILVALAGANSRPRLAHAQGAPIAPAPPPQPVADTLPHFDTVTDPGQVPQYTFATGTNYGVCVSLGYPTTVQVRETHPDGTSNSWGPPVQLDQQGTCFHSPGAFAGDEGWRKFTLSWADANGNAQTLDTWACAAAGNAQTGTISGCGDETCFGANFTPCLGAPQSAPSELSALWQGHWCAGPL